MPIKILGTQNGANFGSAVVDSAVRYAIDHGANIITQSFGFSSAPLPGSSLEEAYQLAIDANILVLAAAGNDNSDRMDYPALHPSIVGVGALSPCDERKSRVVGTSGSCDRDTRDDGGNWGSNYGMGLDFLAPGTLLPSTDVRGVTGYSDNTEDGVIPQYDSVENGDYILDAFGTSMSSPFAAGIASLVWAANPGLKNYQVLYIMRQTARDISPANPDEWDSETGYGALDAKAAVEMAENFDLNSNLLPNLHVEITGPLVFNIFRYLNCSFLGFLLRSR